MRKLLLLITLVLSIKTSYSQPCGARYLDSIFATVNVTTVPFGQNYDYLGNMVNLFADIYTPNGDVATNRAAIIYVHGGGFVGGTRNDVNITRLCNQLAKKGYVVASIDYRLGVPDTTNLQKGKAQLRAIQDLNAFVRYAKANSATVKIDTTKILISGGSAGGATILAKAFLDYSEFPFYIDTTGVGTLEGISNNLSNSNNVYAAYSLWGAVGDTIWIQPGDIPVGCIQSILDPCIPWNFGPSCNVPGYSVYGSNSINKRATSLGIPTTLHGFQSSQHDLGMDSIPFQDTTVMLLSTFYYNLMCGSNIGISENSNTLPIIIYPNPASTTINISFPSNTNYQIQIINTFGEILLTMQNQKSIDISQFPEGIYFIKIDQDNHTYFKKIIKQ